MSALSGKRKRRVGAACDFCRQRKLGCDNGTPKCENCKFQGKSCTYSERVKKTRPTNSQIQQLEEENKQLRISLSKLQSQLRNEQSALNESSTSSQEEDSAGEKIDHVETGIDNTWNKSHLPTTPTFRSEPFTASKQTYIPLSSSNRKPPYVSTGDSELHFHGPSSAMFHESYHHITDKSNLGLVVDRSKRLELLAACIKQRQMEPIDLAAAHLDFDGVDPELGMHLLSVFWNRQHALGSIVYRPAFMRDMACNGPYFSKILLNAIYFSAAKHSTRVEFQCARDAAINDKDNVELPSIVSPFRQRAEELLSACIIPGSPVPVSMKSTITTIQALLIMSDALFVWCDERSLSWLYSGLGINMIFDLGIHTDSRTLKLRRQFSSEDLEIRRRLFWAAFIQDKVQSVYQGRPARLRGVDINVPIVFLDDYEELEQFSALSYSATDTSTGFPTRSVSVFEELCKLSIMMEKILSFMYRENLSENTNISHLLNTARSLHGELDCWRSALPKHLDLNSHDTRKLSLTPHALSLMSMFYSIVILLHRPFVSGGHIHDAPSSIVRESFVTCASAASAIDGILRVYSQRFCITTVPYFMSYATYVSGTIHVRIAAQSVPGSEAHKSLQNCLSVLSEQQGVCRAPRRARQILLQLARQLKVDTGTNTAAPSSLETGTQSELINSSRRFLSPNIGRTGTNRNQTPGFENPFQNAQNDLDFMMSNFDIDVLIQSFDLEQPGITYANQNSDAVQVNEPSTASAPNLSNNSHPSPSSQNIGNFNQWSFQDLLFEDNTFHSDNALIF